LGGGGKAKAPGWAICKTCLGGKLGNKDNGSRLHISKGYQGMLKNFCYLVNI